MKNFKLDDEDENCPETCKEFAQTFLVFLHIYQHYLLDEFERNKNDDAQSNFHLVYLSKFKAMMSEDGMKILGKEVTHLLHQTYNCPWGGILHIFFGNICQLGGIGRSICDFSVQKKHKKACVLGLLVFIKFLSPDNPNEAMGVTDNCDYGSSDQTR